MVGLWLGPAAGGLVEDGGRRWASLLKAASEQDSACDVVVGQVWSCCWRLGGRVVLAAAAKSGQFK